MANIDVDIEKLINEIGKLSAKDMLAMQFMLNLAGKDAEASDIARRSYDLAEAFYVEKKRRER